MTQLPRAPRTGMWVSSSYLGLWLSSAALIIGMTTLPWSDFQGHAHWEIVCWVPFQDSPFSKLNVLNFWANYLLFVPFAYLHVRCWSEGRRMWFLEALLAAACLSFGSELYQVFCHNRVPSMTDVTANLLGATVGAILGFASSRSSPPRLVRTWQPIRSLF